MMASVVYGANCLSGYIPINLSTSVGREGRKIPEISLLAATKKLKVAAPAAETISNGKSTAQGGFFCYFSCPSRKVKRKKPDGYIAPDRKTLTSY
jgi:hypothetical protein